MFYKLVLVVVAAALIGLFGLDSVPRGSERVTSRTCEFGGRMNILETPCTAIRSQYGFPFVVRTTYTDIRQQLPDGNIKTLANRTDSAYASVSLVPNVLVVLAVFFAGWLGWGLWNSIYYGRVLKGDKQQRPVTEDDIETEAALAVLNTPAPSTVRTPGTTTTQSQDNPSAGPLSAPLIPLEETPVQPSADAVAATQPASQVPADRSSLAQLEDTTPPDK